jgi:hypothetical protein
MDQYTITANGKTICLIQINGTRRRVYIKFISEEQMRVIPHATVEQHEYKHENGEISTIMRSFCDGDAKSADAVVRAALTNVGT